MFQVFIWVTLTGYKNKKLWRKTYNIFSVKEVWWHVSNFGHFLVIACTMIRFKVISRSNIYSSLHIIYWKSKRDTSYQNKTAPNQECRFCLVDPVRHGPWHGRVLFWWLRYVLVQLIRAVDWYDGFSMPNKTCSPFRSTWSHLCHCVWFVLVFFFWIVTWYFFHSVFNKW